MFVSIKRWSGLLAVALLGVGCHAQQTAEPPKVTVQAKSPPKPLQAKAPAQPSGARSASGAVISAPDWATLRQSVAQTNAARARSALEELVRREPRFVEAQVNLGVAYEKNGDWLRAEKAYRQAQADAATYIPACHGVARVAGLQGRLARALEALEECLKLPRKKAGDDPAQDREVGEIYLTEADFTWRSGQSKQALEKLGKAFSFLPDDPRGYALLGRIYLEDRKYSSARIFLQKAIVKAEPSNQARLYMDLGRAQLGLGETTEAFASFQKAAQLSPQDLFPVAQMGQLALLNGDGKGAQGYFHQIVDRHPENLQGHLGLGVAYRLSGDFPNAELEYLRALKIDAKNSEALFNLGVLYHKHLKDAAKAEVFYERFVDVAPAAAREKEVAELLRDVKKEAKRKP